MAKGIQSSLLIVIAVIFMAAIGLFSLDKTQNERTEEIPDTQDISHSTTEKQPTIPNNIEKMPVIETGFEHQNTMPAATFRENPEIPTSQETSNPW